jgi:hypothetical protein
MPEPGEFVDLDGGERFDFLTQKAGVEFTS